MTELAVLSGVGFMVIVTMTVAEVGESEVGVVTHVVEAAEALVESATAGAVVAEVDFAMAIMAMDSIRLLLVLLLKLGYLVRGRDQTNQLGS